MSLVLEDAFDWLRSVATARKIRGLLCFEKVRLLQLSRVDFSVRRASLVRRLSSGNVERARKFFCERLLN